MPLGDGAGIECTRETDRDPVVGLVHVGRVAGLDPEDLRTLDHSLGVEEADRQLVLVAGRPHRDRDGYRLLPGPAARISSGSSPTTRSARYSSDGPRTATMRAVVTWRVVERPRALTSGQSAAGPVEPPGAIRAAGR